MFLVNNFVCSRLAHVLVVINVEEIDCGSETAYLLPSFPNQILVWLPVHTFSLFVLLFNTVIG